eukprot:4673570-Amphidinium_carterae.1
MLTEAARVGEFCLHVKTVSEKMCCAQVERHYFQETSKMMANQESLDSLSSTRRKLSLDDTSAMPALQSRSEQGS